VSRIVRKYGGSSLREPEQIKTVARHIATLKKDGHDVVVVVSAMAATTDEFISLARALHSNPPKREMDMLLSVGERVSCSLLAMALDGEGVEAVSYTGSQVGIITDTVHGEAHIVDVRPVRLLEALEKDQVVVVAGFQGVSIEKEITTLGRGGSDATALALAAAIGAERCELMKDVDGIFSADPQVVEQPVLHKELDYDSAQRLARGGSNVLQSEAARLAKEHQVPLRVGRTATDKVGTIITDRPYGCSDIVGIARKDGLRQVRSDKYPENTSDIERLIQSDGIWICWIRTVVSEAGTYSGLTIVQARDHTPGLHRCVTVTLYEAKIQVQAIVSAASELWLCVPTDQADEAIRLLHAVFLEKGWLKSVAND
jgi:aspartate kinase